MRRSRTFSTQAFPGPEEAILVVLFGHPAYYPRYGFVQARTYGIDITQFTVSDEVFMVAELSRPRLITCMANSVSTPLPKI